MVVVKKLNRRKDCKITFIKQIFWVKIGFGVEVEIVSS